MVAIDVNQHFYGGDASRPCLMQITMASLRGTKLETHGARAVLIWHTAMTIPTSVTFRCMGASEALRAKIEERAQGLGRFADDILSCHVVVSACEHRHHQGNRYNVRATVMMRDRDIEAGHASVSNSSREDPYVAVAHTFDILRRRIEDHVHRRRGDGKARPAAPLSAR